MTQEELIQLTWEYKSQLEKHIKIGKIFAVRVKDFDNDAWGECITDLHAEEWYIRFNTQLLSLSELEIRRTVIHELMHCLKSRHGHGSAFRVAYYKACTIIGISSGNLSQYRRIVR